MYATTNQIGQTLGPEVARQVPPVGMAIDQLEKELHYLREIVGQLEYRLVPVMRPVPEESAKVMAGLPGGSPIVNKLESLSQLARNTSAAVGAMLDCLEL